MGSRKAGFFLGYYRHYCFLPPYAFCGGQCLVSYLPPSNIDGAKHSWAILALLVTCALWVNAYGALGRRLRLLCVGAAAFNLKATSADIKCWAGAGATGSIILSAWPRTHASTS